MIKPMQFTWTPYLCRPTARGEALVTLQAIFFFGGVDPETGVLVGTRPRTGRAIHCWKSAGLSYWQGVNGWLVHPLPVETQWLGPSGYCECLPAKRYTTVGCIITEIPLPGWAGYQPIPHRRGGAGGWRDSFCR